jgi:hypothetical protein
VFDHAPKLARSCRFAGVDGEVMGEMWWVVFSLAFLPSAQKVDLKRGLAALVVIAPDQLLHRSSIAALLCSAAAAAGARLRRARGRAFLEGGPFL